MVGGKGETMTKTKIIPIVLLGCGGVGRHLLRHILSCRSLHTQMGLALRVVAVADSRSLLAVSNAAAAAAAATSMDDAFLAELCRAKSSGSPLSSLADLGGCQLFTDSEAKGKIIDVAHLLGTSTGLAVVDCSASSETVNTLKEVMSLGCCVVLANKKPLTCAIEDFEKLVLHFRRIRFESTVGAGLPVIASVTRIIASGDPISRILGSLSGTLGYVMSELEDGKPFSQVVRAAKSLGFTEPDPRDDLSGMDVARKGLILARLLGWKMSLNDIKVESLFPSEFGPGSMTAEVFLGSAIPQLDKSIEERVTAASSKGNVLRYVCVIENSRCQVGVQEIPKDSPLGRLRGSDNVFTTFGYPDRETHHNLEREIRIVVPGCTGGGRCGYPGDTAWAKHQLLVEIYSRCYANSPLVIQGAGAGNDTTAAGVLADIIDLQDLFK